MKNSFFVILFSFIFPIFAKSQKDSTTNKYDTVPGTTIYVQLQYQRTYKISNKAEYLDQYPWTWISVGRKAGAFLFVSREGSDATGISIGPYISFGNKVYSEVGLGMGIEIPDVSTDSDVLYGWSYYYSENNPEFRLAKNKVIFQIQYAHSKEWGSWVMSSFTWTPFQRYFGVGLWGQTNTSWGGKIVGNIPLGGSVVLSTWIGGGIDHKVTWGTDLIIQATGKGKIKTKK